MTPSQPCSEDKPSTRQLAAVAFASGFPFIFFGILDNAIMVGGSRARWAPTGACQLGLALVGCQDASLALARPAQACQPLFADAQAVARRLPAMPAQMPPEHLPPPPGCPPHTHSLWRASR